ncbi:AAA family ATPase [Amycolatopsis sp. NPDC052450]|uniref:helix-turn-helix transcriptional regulator n=1 Tax=Amycolatopsis sp. NPDC052450 TaxID=3363937 RepID=UPI0037C6E1F5
MLHGRDQEIHLIRRLVDDAGRGDPGVLVLRGQAGVGKTALLDEARAHADGVTVLSCSGYELEAGFAFSGLHQLLLPVLDQIDSLPQAQSAALRSALGMTSGQVTDFAVSAAAFSLITTISEQKPVLIVVDDLQWLDGASLAAFMFLVRRLVADPIAVLMAVREPSDLDTSFLPELRLTGLTDDSAAELLDRHGWRSSRQVRTALIETTGGNPLALIELTRGGATGQLAHDLMLSGTVPLSDSLGNVFAKRADELGDQSRLLTLVIAAQNGADVGLTLAAARRLGITETAMEPIEASGLARLSGATVEFSHPLIRSALYQRALSRDRSRVHLALAAELTERGDHPRSIHHRTMAATGPDEALAAELERMAEKVVERGGAAAAAHTMQRAAELSPDPLDHRRRLTAAAFAAWRSGQAEVARAITERIGPALARTGTSVEAQLSRLRGLIETDSGDPSLAYSLLVRSAERIAPELPEDALWLLFLATEAAGLAGDPDGQVEAARRLANLGIDKAYDRIGRWVYGAAVGNLDPESSDPDTVLDSIPPSVPVNDPRRVMLVLGVGIRGHNPRQVRDHGVEVCAQLRSVGMTNVLTTILTWLADLEYHLGLWDSGITHAHEAARLSQDSGQCSRRAVAVALLARFAAVRGDEQSCLEHADLALNLASPLGNRTATAITSWARGQLDLVKADPRGALERMLAMSSPISPHANAIVARRAIPDLVEAAYQVGDLDRVREELRAFELWAGRSNLEWAGLYVDWCRAMVGQGDVETSMKRVLAAAAVSDFPFDHGRIHLFYGGWLRRNRRLLEAREHLRVAAQLFNSLGASPWEANATTELRAAGGQAMPSDEQTAALTPQELHVAQLAARGLSNKEIAMELYISPRTVGYHLYKLFPKLGITARSQLRSLRMFERT